MDKNRLEEIRSVVLDMDNDDPINEGHAVNPDAITYGELNFLLNKIDKYQVLLEKTENVLRNAGLDGMADNINRKVGW